MRKLYRNEVVFRVQIILARFVNHPQQLTFGSLFIWDDLIELADFERSGVAIVMHANDDPVTVLHLTRRDA